ncbi:hypothetical protein [Sphingomonas nostoxanthinifaciens]|uniref:hypothetical protein n=1 Tax=Sphingomonas nostoxanthinifaciens TaxID=2872652 RepID=UPI001CC1E672|nr:hypothetical protein [Sphingomonas nostoxanthinifaciens]UAK24490.1 hypothetical protein K8P63_19660 [Sphingomonas nostoxanthinifaciens]
MFRSAPAPVDTPAGWWNSGWFLALMVLVSIVPLLAPVTPPLTDLAEHMGRYRIQLSDPSSPLRAEYFSFHWAFIANLGVDLLVVPMAALFGLELGVKLIVIGIVALTTTGMIWIAREAHGRVPAPALFALPLAYSFPFIWGFVNFLLSMALALNAYALWLRLGRQGRWRLRNGLFVVIGLVLTTAHIFGWAVLCLLAYAAEVVRKRDAGRPMLLALWEGGLACLSLAPPILLLLVWRSGDAKGANQDFFDWAAKYVYFISILRNHWRNFDLANVYLLWGLVSFGLVGVGVVMNRTLGVAALMLILAYLLLPRILLGSAYADMRLAPYVVMIAVVALAVPRPSRRAGHILAGTATAIFLIRIIGLTQSFAAHDAAAQHQLAALDHVKPGSRVFVQVALQCIGRWETTRMDHLGAMAIVRRDAFANGQWTDPGAQLVRIRYAPARHWAEDPTEILRPPPCAPRRTRFYPKSVNDLPRKAFDYVWMIDLPRANWYSFPGLEPIWTGGKRGILYRVVPTGSATSASDTPTGSKPRTAA